MSLKHGKKILLKKNIQNKEKKKKHNKREKNVQGKKRNGERGRSGSVTLVFTRRGGLAADRDDRRDPKCLFSGGTGGGGK